MFFVILCISGLLLHLLLYCDVTSAFFFRYYSSLCRFVFALSELHNCVHAVIFRTVALLRLHYHVCWSLDTAGVGQCWWGADVGFVDVDLSTAAQPALSA